ncbi:MAG TPA: SIMPL domain-containing protein [Candidatus Nanopelagicaceae bacterium]|nr:SIMPL domain-containing protein [Candidatus Nanopelagicaceae bacterium]
MIKHPMRTALVATAAIFVLGTSSAQAASAANTGITVQATGTVKVTPDAVRLNLTATTLGPSSQAALAATSTTAAGVRAALTADGVAAKDVATTRISVNPEYTYSQDKAPTINGYRASQSFNVVIRKATMAGKVIDDVVAAAGDNATIDSVTPFVLDPNKAEAKARISAVKKARAKAKAYASLLYSRLGNVIYLTEQNSNYTPMPAPYGLGAKAEATQVDLGQQDVSVTIEVRWHLK